MWRSQRSVRPSRRSTARPAPRCASAFRSWSTTPPLRPSTRPGATRAGDPSRP